MTSWGEQGKAIAEKLKTISDEESIKSLGLAAIAEINKIETFKKRDSALKMLNREILKKFPRKESETECYYHDPSGKADLAKWRHLIFKYLTLDSTKHPSEQPTEQPTEQPKQQRKPRQSKQPKQILKTMTIQQLDLDDETQTILKDALEQSGMALEDFIKQAIKVYAKTVRGRSKQQTADLSTIPTQDLLDDPKWSTHPSRAEELTRRAIRAIKFFNANKATENADRWCITQSAIASLTGSRQSTIKQILEHHKDDVDSHNQTYGLNGYSNRKPGKDITEVINLAELIPNGVD